MKLFLDSYGCTLNQADAEIIRGVLRKEEFTDLSDAETVIINTCAVKGATQSKMLSRIRDYLALGKRVVVAGCLPKVNRKLLDEFPVSIVDTNSIDKLPLAIRSRAVFTSSDHKNKLKMPRCVDDSPTGIIEISEGCLSRCAFCGTKNARGDLTSYPVEDIVAKVRLLVEHGKKEIYLTAQDTGCYGLDIHSNLVELLREILKVDGDYRLRIGMMNPNYALKMLNGLIEVYKDYRIYKFLHVPVQSGSDRVIREMNRGYTTKQFEKIAEKFREEIENICLSTDIIVGFPTETDDDFRKTIELVKIVRPDITNISKFCPRPNTAAARMKLLTTQVLKKRSVALSKICKKIILEQNKRYIGQVMECLVIDNNRRLARAPNFKQVFLDRRAEGFVHAKIMDAGHSCLKGEINK